MLRQKTDYAHIHHPVRIMSVGRVIGDKDRTHIIKAVASLGNAHLMSVGDGAERPSLEALAASAGGSEIVRFRPAVDNDKLYAMLPEFNLFTNFTANIGSSASRSWRQLLTGLPDVNG